MTGTGQPGPGQPGTGQPGTGQPTWLRARFSKLGKVRFISHRDVARAWERAVRRAALPISWSQGFSPRPSLSFGLALPTGCESVAEYLDLRLERPVDPLAAREALDAALPAGLEVMALASREHGAQSLQQEVTSCGWELEVEGVSAEELVALAQGFLRSASVPLTRVRKGVESVEDVRPLVRTLDLGFAQRSPRSTAQRSTAPSTEPGTAIPLLAEVATRPRGLRPAELALALDRRLVVTRAVRTRQLIEQDGTRREPLGSLDLTVAPVPVGVPEEATR